MPIKIPDNLPATKILEQENIFVIKESRAYEQDIRPLKILLLNLMPNKIVTETQLLRLLSNTPIQVEVDFLYTASYTPTNTGADHLIKFYEKFETIKDRKYDGMIITGAPVEKMEFEEVDYWAELCEIMEWSKSNVYSTLHICWGAQAGLYYHYNIPKHYLDKKQFGVYPHEIVESVPNKLFTGFDDVFYVPHSRHTENRLSDIEQAPELHVLAKSDIAGPFALSDKAGRRIFLTGHAEYDPNSLKDEYERDINLGMEMHIPDNYYKDNDPQKKPVVLWRSTANLLFFNWLNYYVYQETPYNLDVLAKDTKGTSSKR